MPCTYVSETVSEMRDLECLTAALDKMGHKYTITNAKNGAVVISSRDFRIEFTVNGSDVDRGDGNRRWIDQLKQRYTIERHKKTARKKGYFVKEEMVGDNIQLSLRK